MVNNKQTKKYKSKEEADMFSFKTRARVIVMPGSKILWKF